MSKSIIFVIAIWVVLIVGIVWFFVINTSPTEVDNEIEIENTTKTETAEFPKETTVPESNQELREGLEITTPPTPEKKEETPPDPSQKSPSSETNNDYEGVDETDPELIPDLSVS